MELEFGLSVRKEMDRLKEQGMDVNQIASVLWKKDKLGHNYGIGIILNDKAQAMGTSPTLLKYAKDEVEKSLSGDYKNSNGILEDVKKAVLTWQRIPENYWDRFKLILPSDAGTGSILTAIQAALTMDNSLQTLGIEELGWPAYRAMAKSCRLSVKEYTGDSVMSDKGVLPLYQAGPMNTTGQVRSRDLIQQRAKKGAEDKKVLILDRAYSGFEFARDILSKSYDDVMKMSYDLQIKPFLDAGATFLMALSPTKAFLTFALRPCGFLLLFNPDPSKDKDMTNILNTTLRARGSSFEHPLTRAFAQAMVKDRGQFELEHQTALKRLADVEVQWKKFVKGTAIEYLFSNVYAGLFRNPLAKDDAPENIFNEHLYPVFSSGRCRLNVTGLPADPVLAQKHVAVFSKFCY